MPSEGTEGNSLNEIIRKQNKKQIFGGWLAHQLARNVLARRLKKMVFDMITEHGLFPNLKEIERERETKFTSSLLCHKNKSGGNGIHLLASSGGCPFNGLCVRGREKKA